MSLNFNEICFADGSCVPVRSSEREVKQMNTIGIALISFGIGLIISWKLAERDIKNAKKKTKNRE